MQLAQAARDQGHERGGDECVGEQVPAVGDLHRTAGPLPKEGAVFYAFQGEAERVLWGPSGASGQIDLHDPGPLTPRARQFGSVRLWIGFPWSGPFDATNVVVAKAQ
jgi:hypothetical protein